MFIKDNIIYSDAFKYLYNTRINAVAFQFTESHDWEERPLPDDFDIELQKDVQDGETIGHKAFFCNHLFVATLPIELTYASVKTAIIQKRYSMDDQMAIMLNKDNSEDTLMYYNKMQEWRDFAAFFARKIVAMM